MNFHKAQISTDLNGEQYLEIFVEANSIVSSYVYYLLAPQGHDNSATIYRMNNLLNRLGLNYLVPLSFKERITFLQLLGDFNEPC